MAVVLERAGPLRTVQAQVGLVDQGGRLQGLAGGLAGQLPRRQSAQFAVDQRQELAGRLRVTLFEVLEDVRHIAHAGQA
jgi:hypothetical protein